MVEQMVEQTFFSPRAPLFFEKTSSRSLFLGKVLFYAIFEFWGTLKMLSFEFDIVSTIKIRIRFGSELSSIFLVLKSIRKRLDMICCIVFFFAFVLECLIKILALGTGLKGTSLIRTIKKYFCFMILFMSLPELAINLVQYWLSWGSDNEDFEEWIVFRIVKSIKNSSNSLSESESDFDFESLLLNSDFDFESLLLNVVGGFLFISDSLFLCLNANFGFSILSLDPFLIMQICRYIKIFFLYTSYKCIFYLLDSVMVIFVFFLVSIDSKRFLTL